MCADELSVYAASYRLQWKVKPPMKFEKSKQKDIGLVLDSDTEPSYEAERLAHQRFGVDGYWKHYDFSARFQSAISPGLAAFVESLPFFFIATANQGGECDCSFRGREHDASGRAYALLKVIDPKTLIFPDYSGNKFFNSLGNILVNSQIGMLCIDFERRLRARINGRAKVIEDRAAYAEIWPLAQRYIEVRVVQAYGNCQARIPLMRLMQPSDSFFQDE